MEHEYEAVREVIRMWGWTLDDGSTWDLVAQNAHVQHWQAM